MPIVFYFMHYDHELNIIIYYSLPQPRQEQYT